MRHVLFLKYGNILIAVLLLFSFFKIYGPFNDKKSGIIRSDGFGYYSYLPALFIYGDLTQSFTEQAFKDNYSAGGIPEYMEMINGHPVDKYFTGEAVLLYPFFISAHWLSIIFHQPADGYSIFYQYFTGFAAIFYVFLGCIFISRLLIQYGIDPRYIFLINTLLVFGTNLFHYTVVEPSMSHAYSYSMIAGFLFYARDSIHNQRKTSLYFASISFALVCLLRPVNGLIILAVPFIAGSSEKLISFISYLSGNIKLLVASILIAGCIVLLQSLMWYLQTGKGIVYAYTYEKFNFNQPEVLNVLFSYRKGLFVWTPALLLAIPGFILLLRKRYFEFFTLAAFFIALVYIVSCWYMWYYGMSFGFRPLIEFFPLFAVLIGLTFSQAKRTISKTILIIFSLLFIYVNQVQAYQYRNYILHWKDMNKESYWKVFLKTDDQWRGYLWK